MPNWTENTLVVQATTKKEIDDFLDEVIVDEEFDFNTIIRMPHELSEGLGLAGSCLQGEDRLKSTMILNDGVYVPKDIKTRKSWIKKFGADNWYRWSCDNWGTKWNACRTKIERVYDEEVTIVFETAWCTPSPIIKKLKKTFKDLNISGGWIDEAWEGAGSFRDI